MALAKVLLAFCFVIAGGASFGSSFAEVVSQSASTLTTQKLRTEIAGQLKNVREFQFIEEEARKLGVRVWLFGGTAAGFGHYVKWDTLRKSGDIRYQKERFDYDFTNIYRSTQDLDIVVDGPPEKARALQNLLMEKYPHLQGSKSAWEVRTLSQPMGEKGMPGYKEALLNNWEFLNQHTDSNSTGMIELTKPPLGESLVRDLRDWASKEPNFLKDVAEGKLHYYFSQRHVNTSRYLDGINPPIFSAIRALTKAFQYELDIRPEDWEVIEKIVRDFDPNRDLQKPAARDWLEKNGKKLIQHAVNIEKAVSTLDRLKLREKLAAIRRNASTQDSLAWWMSKEPLKSFDVGTGNGKTAAQIAGELGQKELIVAHETRDFLAFESITRAHTGDPNVLTSRQHAEKQGETAAYGDGFYTKIGRKGARNTGFTIRFTVRPEAREGTDFKRVDNFLIFHNKNALGVIPESLNLGPVEYFRLLGNMEKLDSSDKGILEKFRRRLGAKVTNLSDAEFLEIRDIIRNRIAGEGVNWSQLSEWLDLPRSEKFSDEILDDISKPGYHDIQLSQVLSERERFRHHPKGWRLIKEIEGLKAQFRGISHRKRAESFRKWIQSSRRSALRLVPEFLKDKSVEIPELILKEFGSEIGDEAFFKQLLSEVSERIPQATDRTEFIKAMIDLVLSKEPGRQWIEIHKELLNLSSMDALLHYARKASQILPDRGQESVITHLIEKARTGPVLSSEPLFKLLIDGVFSSGEAVSWFAAQRAMLEDSSIKVLLHYYDTAPGFLPAKESGPMLAHVEKLINQPRLGRSVLHTMEELGVEREIKELIRWSWASSNRARLALSNPAVFRHYLDPILANPALSQMGDKSKLIRAISSHILDEVDPSLRQTLFKTVIDRLFSNPSGWVANEAHETVVRALDLPMLKYFVEKVLSEPCPAAHESLAVAVVKKALSWESKDNRAEVKAVFDALETHVFSKAHGKNWDKAKQSLPKNFAVTVAVPELESRKCKGLLARLASLVRGGR